MGSGSRSARRTRERNKANRMNVTRKNARAKLKSSKGAASTSPGDAHLSAEPNNAVLELIRKPKDLLLRATADSFSATDRTSREAREALKPCAQLGRQSASSTKSPTSAATEATKDPGKGAECVSAEADNSTRNNSVCDAGRWPLKSTWPAASPSSDSSASGQRAKHRAPTRNNREWLGRNAVAKRGRAFAAQCKARAPQRLHLGAQTYVCEYFCVDPSDFQKFNAKRWFCKRSSRKPPAAGGIRKFVRRLSPARATFR